MKDLFVYALRHWTEIFAVLAALAVGGAIGIALGKHITRDVPKKGKVQ